MPAYWEGMNKMDNMTEQQRFLTVAECADVLRVAAGHIRREIKAGNLKAIMVRRNFLIERNDLEEYIQSLAVIPNA